MARLTVSRRSPADARERQVIVSVDGEKVATLMFGDEVTRDLPPGRHRLRVHNTLVWKTRHFDVAATDDVRFTVVNRPGGSTTGLLTILGARPLYLDLLQE